MNERIYGFPPVFREDAQILILGSMPSVESLKQSFYYAHPRNVFWRMMAEILCEAPPQTTEEKKALLIGNKIALWDTVGSCEREGSLDSAIRSAEANDFHMLFKACTDIKHIFFNGAAAQQLFIRLVGADKYKYSYRRLPSTSPAYTLCYEKKLSAWKSAFEEAQI